MTAKLKRNIKRIIAGSVIFALGFVFSRFVNEWAGLAVYIAAYVVIGGSVLKNAVITISHGHVFDENFLMIIATIGAFFCMEYSEAVAVMLFFQIGECFQTYAVNKSRKSIRALMSIRPDFARVIIDGEEKEVDPSEVKVGDTIVIKPGERIPLDAVVVSGNSSIDTAAITGESLPRDVFEGDKIVSGCVNNSGLLTARVLADAGQSTVSKVLELVEEASAKKAKAERFITVFARYYTPIIVFLALGLAVIGSLITKDAWTWVYRAMTFLLISCPCALVISIPLSFFGGIGGAGRKGILIKGGNYMDTLSKVDTLVLDKTGTITKGNFALSKVGVTEYGAELLGEDAENRLLETAAYCETYSTHPIGQSIVSRYNRPIDKNLIGEVKEIAGKGVEAVVSGNVYHVGNDSLMETVLEGDEHALLAKCKSELEEGTIIYVAYKGRMLGHMQIIDEVKEDSVSAIAAARTAGIKKTVMLTGDNYRTAKAVATIAGIDEFYAELSPLDKVSVIEKILENKTSGKVAFVGDGINDAPVLSRADIGIAMGALGSDAAIEAADVVIMTDELSRIPTAIHIARKTLRIVKENIVFALGVKVLVLVLAALGIAHMSLAIFADVGVALIAILNAMRPLKN